MILTCPCCGRILFGAAAPIALTPGAVMCWCSAALSLRNQDGAYVLDVLAPGGDYPEPDWVVRWDEAA